jgi:hypothetical protein
MGDTVAAPSSLVVPEDRTNHTAVVHDGKLYVFGGVGAGGCCPPLLWELDLSTFVWRTVPTKGQVPVARFGHTASLVSARMVIFGGMSHFPHGLNLNDCFVFNFSTSEWKELDAHSDEPKVASQPISPAAVGSVEPSWAISRPLGSSVASSGSADDGDRSKPFGRRLHAAAWDSTTNSVVIFGGWNGQDSDSLCFNMIVAPPTLKELVRNFIVAADSF